MTYYTVLKGYTPGIYNNWKKAEMQVKGFPGAKYKKFETFGEADYYFKTGKLTNPFSIIKINPGGIIVEAEINCSKNYFDVWTDGSSFNNGKENCKASYGVYFSDGKELSGEITENPSNQRAELMAIWVALENSPRNKKIRIFTDSQYSINCITKWAEKWKVNNWKKADNSDVKHKNLIRDLNSMYNTVDIKFIHVRSHKVAPSDKMSEEYRIWYGNFMADKIANDFFLVKKQEVIKLEHVMPPKKENKCYTKTVIPAAKASPIKKASKPTKPKKTSTKLKVTKPKKTLTKPVVKISKPNEKKIKKPSASEKVKANTLKRGTPIKK